MQKPCIKVWAYAEAPDHLKTRHIDDADWLALCSMTSGLRTTLAAKGSFLAEGSPFGCCSVVEYTHPDCPDWIIFVGTHS